MFKISAIKKGLIIVYICVPGPDYVLCTYLCCLDQQCLVQYDRLSILGLDYSFVYYLKESLIVFFRFASRVATTICTLSRRSSVHVDGAWSRGDLHSRRLCMWMGPVLEVIRHK